MLNGHRSFGPYQRATSMPLYLKAQHRGSSNIPDRFVLDPRLCDYSELGAFFEAQLRPLSIAVPVFTEPIVGHVFEIDEEGYAIRSDKAC